MFGVALAEESGFDTVVAGAVRPGLAGGLGGSVGFRLMADEETARTTSEISTSSGAGVDRLTTTCFTGAVLLDSFFRTPVSFTGVPAGVTGLAG